jgi:hypothetical protein
MAWSQCFVALAPSVSAQVVIGLQPLTGCAT